MTGLSAEPVRLSALQDSGLLDPSTDLRFDNIAALARDIFETPIALITLLDHERQTFKANVGLEHICGTPRNIAFCDHAIRQTTVMVVEDALEDPRFRDNPLVTEDPHIRFYAGAPVITSEGHAFGTVCIIDHEPREFSSRDRQRLSNMAGIVQGMFESQIAAGKSRKQRAEQIRADRLHQVILDSTDVGFMSFSPVHKDGEIVDFMITAANRANERINGYTPADLVGSTILQCFPGLRDDPHFDDYLTVMETGESIHREIHYTKDGLNDWFDGTFVRFDDNTLTVSFYPITDRVTFQRTLEQIASLAPVAATNPSSYIRELLEIGTKALGMSHGFCAQIDGENYTPREVFGDTDMLQPGVTVPLNNMMCALVVESKNVVAIPDLNAPDISVCATSPNTMFKSFIGAPVYRGGHLDGAVSFASGQTMPQQFQSWQKNLISMIALKIGNALDLEAAFKREREQSEDLRAVLDHLPARIWFKDNQNHVIRANAAAASYVKASNTREIEGQPLARYFPEDAANMQAADNLTFANGVAERNIVASFTGPLGETRWKSSDRIPILSDPENPRLLVFVSDITEQKQTEAELARLNQSLSEFAFVAAHDLQAPLRNSALFAELLRSELDVQDITLNEEANSHLEEVEKGLARMREMVSDLYDLFRLDSQTIELKPVDLTDVALAAADQVTSALTELDAKLTIEKLPIVNGNSSLLIQLFQNLLSNACKYAEVENLVIRVHAETDIAERKVRVFVDDNGQGIPRHAMRTVFEPFKRLHQNTDIPGAGVGLSLCRKISNIHGAELYVDSSYEDGARFAMAFDF